LISDQGEVLLHHRKINELDIAREMYGPGDRLGVVDTRFGRLGLMICADAFAPGQVISRTLAMMGARVILSPCAWAVPPDHDNSKTPYGQLWIDNYGPVSREFKVWIAGCSNVGPIKSGPWAGHKCIGCSMVLGPNGEKRLGGSYGEGAEDILYLDVE
jgi:predicted amidohydrolase